MTARSSSHLVGLLAVVALGLVAWLVISLSGREHAPSTRHETVSASSESEKPGSAQLAPPDENTPAQHEEKRAIPERLEVADEGPTSAELATALWVGGRVMFPDQTPTDERAFVVAVGREFGSKKLHRVPVAADGTFKVAFAPSTKKATLRLDARYVFLEEPKALKLDEAKADIVLAPALGGGLRGRVKLDAATQRFAAELVGVTVEVMGWKPGLTTHRKKTTKLDADLAFEVGGLDPAIGWRVSCADAAKRFAAATVESAAVSAGRFETLELAIARGAEVSGTVRDEKGKPVAGAQLHTDARPRTGGIGPGSGATSDEEGRFERVGLRAGDAHFVVEAQGFVPHTFEVAGLAAGEVRRNVDVTLSRGLSISGSARFSDGRPASDLTVSAEPYENHSSPYGIWFDHADPSAKTDAEGKFTITGLEAGKHVVSARSAPMDAENAPPGTKRPPRVRYEDRREDVTAGTTGLVLTLESGSSLSGRVVDDVGAPVAAFAISYARRGTNPWETKGRREILSKGKDGSFQLTGLAEGSWEIQAKTKDAGESVELVVKIPEEARPLELVVQRPSTVRGTVLDPAGTPVAGAQLRIDRSDATLRYWSNESNAEKTDERGAFELKTRPGSMQITAVHSNWASSEKQSVEVLPASSAGPLTLRLRRGGAIAGRVLDRTDKPSSGRSVHVWAGESSQNRTSDAEGRFRFENVPPGEAQVTIQPTEAELAATRDAQGETDWQAAQPLNGNARVTVVDGQVVEVVLGGSPKNALKVTGVVRAGAPLPRIKLQFWGPMEEKGASDSRVATTDEAGRYEVFIERPGKYSVSFEREDEARTTLQVEIPPGAGFVYDITLPSGSLSGRVLDAQGASIGAVRVHAYARQKGAAGDATAIYSADVRSTDDGKFTLRGLSAGTYSLQASADYMGGRRTSKRLLGQAVAHEIALAEGASVDGIVLRFPVTGSVRGIVRNRDGAPAPGVHVMARPVAAGEDYSVGGGARTNPDGTYTIEGLGVGTYSIRAQSKQDTSQESTGVEVRDGASSEVNLTLEPGNTLLVSCVDAKGKLIKTWFEVKDGQGRTQNVMYFGEEDDAPPPENTQRFKCLPDGEYTVRVRSKSETRVEERVSLRGGVTREVRLRLPE